MPFDKKAFPFSKMAYAYNQGPIATYDSSAAPGRTLWMGELDQWMDENYLRQLWWSMGQEVSCRISVDKYGGSYAFVDFANHQEASKALLMNGTQIPQTNKCFKLNWSNRDGNGLPFINP